MKTRDADKTHRIEEARARHANKESEKRRKREESEAREAARAERTDVEQLNRLNVEKYTAKRERTRIASRLGISIEDTYVY